MVPFATPGRKRSFCSWFPQLTMGGTPMPLPAPRAHITPLYPFYISEPIIEGFIWVNVPRGPSHQSEREYESYPTPSAEYHLGAAHPVQLLGRDIPTQHVVSKPTTGSVPMHISSSDWIPPHPIWHFSSGLPLKRIRYDLLIHVLPHSRPQLAMTGLIVRRHIARVPQGLGVRGRAAKRLEFF